MKVITKSSVCMSRIGLLCSGISTFNCSSVFPPDLPNEMAWGKKKKLYYDSDYMTTSKPLSFPSILLSQFMVVIICTADVLFNQAIRRYFYSTLHPI